MEKRITEKGNSYWNNTGAYQEENDRLWSELVPAQGSANSVHGELIRAVNRLFYEFCNNGNCNAIEFEMHSCYHCGGDGSEYSHTDDDGEEFYEDCSWCDGSGQEEGNPEITGYYEGFLNFIEEHAPSAPVNELRKFMLNPSRGYSQYKFDDYEMGIYNALTDAVMYHILTTENAPLEITENA